MLKVGAHAYAATGAARGHGYVGRSAGAGAAGRNHRLPLLRRQKRAVGNLRGTLPPYAPRAPPLTPRLQAARDRNIPIVTQAWVHACVANGQPLAADQVAQYLLPPFTGLRICVTGLEVGVCRLASDAATAVS